MKHPFYITIATLTCLYLLLANLRGWTIFGGRSANRWGSSGRVVFHK